MVSSSRQFLLYSVIVAFLLLSVLAQSGEATGLTPEASQQLSEQTNATKKTIQGYINQFFGFFTFLRIEGAKGPSFFSAEFLAAFFLVYFLMGQIPAMEGIPKILFCLFLTAFAWNIMGGMRWERFIILLIPPTLVYYILYESISNFTLVQWQTAQLIAVAAAAIAFLFYSPQLVSYLDGRVSYGLIDTLAGSSWFLFIVVIFGFIVSKFSITVLAPLQKPDAMKVRQNFEAEIQRMEQDPDPKVREKAKRVRSLMGQFQAMQQMGGG